MAEAEIGSGSVVLLHSVDMELEIAEVILADVELKHFIDDRQQVMQRSNGLERNGIRRPEDTARCGQEQGVFDGRDRHTVIIKNSGEAPIIATDNAGGSGRAAIGVENLADVIGFGDLHDFVSRFSLGAPATRVH